MSNYEIHTVESAPEASKPLLRTLESAMGVIPNLAASMAESPELLTGFLSIRNIFYGGSFSPGQIQVLALTNAFENGCSYCMAFHSTLALQEGISKEAVEALRTGRSPQDPALGALSDFSRALVKHRGQVNADDLQTFIAAGYTRRQALEVVLGIAASILPNFAHHLTQCPLDEAFTAQAWTSDDETRPARDAAAVIG